MDEVILNGTKSKLDVTVELQAFGLVILILTLTPFRFGGTSPQRAESRWQKTVAQQELL
jgi:hypothetical protein